MSHAKAISAHTRHKKSGNVPLKIFLGCILAVFVFLLVQVYIPSYRQLQMSNVVLEKLEAQSIAQQDSIQKIDKEMVKLKTDQYLMLLAREKYDYSVPGEKLYKMMPSPNVQPVVASAPKKVDNSSWLSKTWDRIYLVLN